MTATRTSDEAGTGRQIHLTPVPTGLWPVILGATAMVLGPLFGFLYGTMRGVDEKVADVNVLYVSLLVGFLVAAIGLIAVLLGARRLVLDARARADHD